MLTHRQRALKTFNFEQVDIPSFDLMENAVWPEISEFFNKKYGAKDDEAVLNLLDSDYRWLLAMPKFDEEQVVRETFASGIGTRPLSDVDSVSALDKLYNPDPENRVIPDFLEASKKYPNHALVFCPLWMPAFSGACQDFGMENALMNLIAEPDIMEAYVKKTTEFAVEVLKRGIQAGAAEHCDFYWIGDDFAANTGLMLSPELWRKLFKPGIAKQVELAKSAGFKVLFHSCGSVEEVYDDLIEIGVDAHCGVQTSAKNMDIDLLAKKYGGKFVIYGGVDAQTTLISGTPDQVIAAVKHNIEAFSNCGGYVVSNSHHGLSDISGENLVAMARAADRKV